MVSVNTRSFRVIYAVAMMVLFLQTTGYAQSDLSGFARSDQPTRERKDWEGTPLTSLQAYPNQPDSYYEALVMEYYSEQGSILDMDENEYCSKRISILLPKPVNGFWVHGLAYCVSPSNGERLIELYLSAMSSRECDEVYESMRSFLRDRFGRESIVKTDDGFELHWNVYENSEHTVILRRGEDNMLPSDPYEIRMLEYGF